MEFYYLMVCLGKPTLSVVHAALVACDMGGFIFEAGHIVRNTRVDMKFTIKQYGTLIFMFMSNGDYTTGTDGKMRVLGFWPKSR